MSKRIHVLSLLVIMIWNPGFFTQILFAQTEPVTVTVDATAKKGKLKHVWQYYGYDECNYTTVPDSVALMEAVAEMNSEQVYLRQHFLLNSGDGVPSLKWGSTNAYTENENGEPVYDWTIMDGIMDAVVASGCLPLVEIGFMPKDLTSHTGPYRNSDTYRLDGGCYYPPKDYDKWAGLIRAWAQHSKEKYPQLVKRWLWELWNEPNIDYFHSDVNDYIKLYEYTEHALHEVLPEVTLGGPHTAGVGREFLRAFLDHCGEKPNSITGKTGTRLDYIGFHAKGGVRLREGYVQMNMRNQLRQHQEGFSIVSDYPKFNKTPIIIGEADPDGCAGCPSSQFPERNYRNFPAYGAYEAVMMKYSLDLAAQENVNLQGVVTWAWMFDGQKWFEGFRSLSTNGVHKPVLNAFKMLGQLTGDEIALTSSGALGVDEILRSSVRERPDINGMAVVDGEKVKILLWNYHDLLAPAPSVSIQLKTTLPDGFPARAKITHYRIDDEHSNAYTKWMELGSPQDPDEEAIKQLKIAMQLQMLEPVKTIDVNQHEVTLDFNLPRFGLSLVIIEPAVKNAAQ